MNGERSVETESRIYRSHIYRYINPIQSVRVHPSNSATRLLRMDASSQLAGWALSHLSKL